MAENPKPMVNVPPFPPLKWNDYFWTGRVVLPSWRGFQSRQGAYGAKSSKKESDGTARLSVQPPGDAAEQPPAAEQADALRYLLEHDEAVRDAILAAVLEEYPAMRTRYDYDEDEMREVMPPVERPDQFQNLLGLGTVHVLNVSHDGTAYVGFEFGCTWDDEHGLGVVTHRDRVVMIAGGDLASEAWVGQQDAEQQGGF